jgi:hypothetical protein
MAKPKLALIPAAQGSKFYSVLPSDGVGDFDFARASAATRINKYGLIETVASGQSRLNYPLIDGVVKGCPSHLLEPLRTQLIQYSEDFSNAYWTKYDTSINVNQGISPNGSVTSDKVIEDTGTSTHQVGRLFSFSSGSTYSVSVFAKYNGRNIQISAGNTGTWAGNVKFDLENGVVSSEINGTGKIKKLANGWFKCTVIGTALATASTNINFGLLNNETSNYTGDGTSGVLLWGAQLELGSYPTSYIVSNSGSATTRVAETANNSGDASTFNDSEGVLMAEISALADDLNTEGISVSDGSTSNRVVIFKWNVSNTIRVRVASSGTNYVNENLTLSDITDVIKIAVKYKQNDFSIFINGFELFSENTGLTPIGLDSLQFNSDGLGGSPFYGNTKQIQYFDSALTDSELETLTSWTSFSEMATSQLYSIQ